MIKTFSDQESFDIYYRENSRKARQRLPRELWDKARECLDALDQAKRPKNLEQFDLKQLTGDRKGKYSIRINRQYRITFQWDDGDAKDVKIEDYHD